MQERGNTCSVTPGPSCGKKSHTLVGVIGVRVVEVEAIAFCHTI